MKANRIRILSFVIVMAVLLAMISIGSVSASTKETDNALSYQDEILELLGLDENVSGFEFFEVSYEEVYRHYEDTEASSDATPDYVMAMVIDSPVPEIHVSSYMGEYVIVTGPFSPYIHGYHIYIPSENKVYTLEEAYYADVAGLDKALESLSSEVALVGDCDGNNVLNVKDATCVQKRIAGLNYPRIEFWEDDLVYDFDRDGERNVKDATAIQKCVAGLPY